MARLRHHFIHEVNPPAACLRDLGSLNGTYVNGKKFGARGLADASVFAVFIDGEHDEPSVTPDIAAWWPKVAPGGYLSGHDWNHREVRAAVASFATSLGKP